MKRYTVHIGQSKPSFETDSLPEAIAMAKKLWNRTVTVTVIDHIGTDFIGNKHASCWAKLARKW